MIYLKLLNTSGCCNFPDDSTKYSLVQTLNEVIDNLGYKIFQYC